MTISRLRGRVKSMFLRLCSRAPLITIASRAREGAGAIPYVNPAGLRLVARPGLLRGGWRLGGGAQGEVLAYDHKDSVRHDNLRDDRGHDRAQKRREREDVRDQTADQLQDAEHD